MKRQVSASFQKISSNEILTIQGATLATQSGARATQIAPNQSHLLPTLNLQTSRRRLQ